MDLFDLYTRLPVFALVASRLGGLIMFQPMLGAAAVPAHVRALFVLGLAALLTPFVDLPAQAPASGVEIALAMGGEILLGALIGLVMAACFLGLQWGAQLLAQEAGLAFGQVLDPTSDEEETVFGVFYVQLALVTFLVIGGHRLLVAACLDSFATIPLLGARPDVAAGLDLLLRALSLGGELALRIAAPTLLALLLVNVALGFVSRTMPQLNVLAVGFSIKALLAFVLMAVSLPSAAEAFLGTVDEVCGRLTVWLGA